MESFLNRRYKKKQAETQKEDGDAQKVPEQKQDQTQNPKKGQLYQIKEADRASTFSSQASTLRGKDGKEKIPLQHTRRGKFLDTAAAFVGLPHICSDE